MGALFILEMSVQGSLVLDDSIFTNLPYYFDTEKPECRFFFLAQKIRCKNIGSFIFGSDHEYFLAFKLFLDPSTPSTISLGAIEI